MHFTGYEVPFDQIRLDDRAIASSATCSAPADMIAQISDRCYLEKCRDRLYPEFVLGGVAMSRDEAAASGHYDSGLDVLRQTPEFFAETCATRLDGEFGAAYRYLETLYSGRNPYMEAIERNLEYLDEVLRSRALVDAPARSAVFTWERNPLQNIRSLVIGHLKQVWKSG